MERIALLLTGFCTLGALVGCRQAGEGGSSFTLSEPANFVRMAIPPDNPVTEKGVALGRSLFYDPILSREHNLACADCHRQSSGFADTSSFSLGAAHIPTDRNTPSLVNIGYHYRGIFWDGRAESLEQQVLASITDRREMAANWPDILGRLNAHPRYPTRFAEVFGNRGKDKPIDSLEVAQVIAQFERTLISAGSKYDRFLSGKAALTQLEERGRLIFFDESEDLPDAECAHCHTDPLFTSLQYFNNGLEATDSLQWLSDPGRGMVTGKYFDTGKFKTPTLRNIAQTAPYMHDGRFGTLEEVIDHYDDGGHYSDNASPNVRRLGLSPVDKKALVAFLHCLTDSVFLEKSEFGDPAAKLVMSIH